MKTVVAGLIEKDGKFLIAKRATGNPNMVGKWEFPGGKVEDGETKEEALEREIVEEFNTMVKVGKKLAEVGIDEEFELVLFECKHVLGAYQLKDHSEVRWLDNVSEALEYDLAEADRYLLSKIMKVSASNDGPRLDLLEVGAQYTNAQITAIFRVSSQGGMRRSLRANALVLLSRHDSSNPYDDIWKDGVFYYTGMGLKGDQKLEKQNKTLAESGSNKVAVYLFESFDGSAYVYRGRVRLAGRIYFEKQPDANGAMRDAMKFPLELI